MAATHVLGVDPGPTTGMVVLHCLGGHLVPAVVLQCNADAAPTLLALLLDRFESYAVAIEAYVIGPRAASTAAGAGERTRTLIGELTETAHARGTSVHVRSAAQVKPWATDERLDTAGLLATTKGMRHARDAARHALYALVRDRVMPDPMRGRGGRR